jgi:hypothetical protein
MAEKKSDKPLSKEAKAAESLLAQEELSAEDQEIKDKLELCVERLEDREAGIR